MTSSATNSFTEKWWGVTAILAVVAFGLPFQADAAGLSPELPGIQVLEQRIESIPVISLRNPQLTEMTVSLEFTLENLQQKP